MKFQILMTLGLVIDGNIKTSGRLPSSEEIKQMLLKVGAIKWLMCGCTGKCPGFSKMDI